MLASQLPADAATWRSVDPEPGDSPMPRVTTDPAQISQFFQTR